MTVTVLPATEMVPVRAAPPLPPTRYETVPFPLPDALLVMAIHPTLDAAVQPQSLRDAETLKLPFPPL